MIDTAYDINYLLDAEPARIEMPPTRVSAVPETRKPTPADAHEAMARELLQAAVIHEALVQQFLRMYGPLDEPAVQR